MIIFSHFIWVYFAGSITKTTTELATSGKERSGLALGKLFVIFLRVKEGQPTMHERELLIRLAYLRSQRAAAFVPMALCGNGFALLFGSTFL